MNIVRNSKRLILTASTLFFATTSLALSANFTNVDTDGDGLLQQSELVSQFGDVSSGYLNKWDADGDGAISRREIRETNKKNKEPGPSRDEDSDDYKATEKAAKKVSAEKAAKKAAEKKAAAQKAAKKAAEKKAAAEKAAKKEAAAKNAAEKTPEEKAVTTN